MNNIATITQNKGGFLMEPQNLQEAMQLAEMLANSNLVPKAYQGKAGDVLVACQWGSEIGLKPLQALQNIAVINNVPAVWGDALVALVRGSGLCEYIKQDWDAATKTAICSVKRRGEPEETRTFSEEDARLAGHLNKDTYKKNLQRMLSIRARAFALRDVFPDVLRGMPIAEEVMDMGERDVTPSQPRVQAEPQALPAYTDEQLAENLPKWQAAMDAGRTSPSHIIANIRSKYVISAEQIEKIEAMAPIEGEQA